MRKKVIEKDGKLKVIKEKTTVDLFATPQYQDYLATTKKQLPPEEQWLIDHEAIKSNYISLCRTIQTPSIMDIANATGLDVALIFEHIRSMQIEDIAIEYRLKAINVLEALYIRAATTGNSNDVRTFLELVFSDKDSSKFIKAIAKKFNKVDKIEVDIKEKDNAS